MALISASSWAWWLLGTGILAIKLHLLFTLIQSIRSGRRKQREMKMFPGPPAHWFFGNLPEVLSIIKLFQGLELLTCILIPRSCLH